MAKQSSTNITQSTKKNNLTTNNEIVLDKFTKKRYITVLWNKKNLMYPFDKLFFTK